MSWRAEIAKLKQELDESFDRLHAMVDDFVNRSCARVVEVPYQFSFAFPFTIPEDIARRIKKIRKRYARARAAKRRKGR